MNIVQLALRRIAVRKTENVITSSFKQVTNIDNTPKDYEPQLPSLKKTFKGLFLLPLVVVGALVWLGLLSLLSFTLAIIISVIMALLFLINGLIINKTNDKKQVELRVADRRYKEGYRSEGYINIIDPDNFIEFSSSQKIFHFIENLIFSCGVMGGLFLIYLIRSAT